MHNILLNHVSTSLIIQFLKKKLADYTLLIFQGKGVSIWDTFSHSNRTKNGDTGDVACDVYHKYLTDIALLKDLKVL